jgi:O-succinylbenzoate synthase
MVPNSGGGAVINFACSTSKRWFDRSPLCRRGEPDPLEFRAPELCAPELRAKVKCGLYSCGSRGILSPASLASIAPARAARLEPAFIPIQNTRGAREVGKNP